MTEERRGDIGKKPKPWAPGGASTYNRVTGFGPMSVTVAKKGGAASAGWTGRGKPAGRFLLGAFRLGR